MNRPDNAVSILLVDGHAISWMRVAPGATGIDVLDSATEIPVDPMLDDALAVSLRAFVRRHSIEQDRVFTVLPRHEMTVRILELPSREPAEIADMVRLGAEEYVPFPLDELYVDQCTLCEAPDGAARVLAAFVHRDVVETHLRLLKDVGIVPDQIYLSTICLAAALSEVMAYTEAACAVAHLASSGLEFLVMERGQIAYGRAVATQEPWKPEPTDAQSQLTELAHELQASIAAYRRSSENTEELRTLHLTSEAVPVQAYCDGLSGQLGLRCEAAPGPGSLVMLGAALLAQGRAATAVRLLPDRLVQAKEAAGLKRSALRLAAIAVALILSVTACYAQSVWRRTAYLRELETRVAELAPRAEGIAEKEHQLKLLREQVDATNGPVELLAGLCEILPASGMNLTRFVYRRGESIEFCGRSLALDAIAQLVKDLNAQTTYTQFVHAQSMYEKQTTEHDRQVYEFKIAVPLSAAAQSEPPSAPAQGAAHE